MKSLTFDEQFMIYLQSGFPLIGIRTREVDRVRKHIYGLTQKFNESLRSAQSLHPESWLRKNGLMFYTWNVADGFVPTGAAAIPGTDKNPDLALAWMAKEGTTEGSNKPESLPGVYVMENLHLFLLKPQLLTQLPIRIQFMRNVYEVGKRLHKHLFIVGDFDTLPEEIQPYIVMLDFKLPTQDQIADYITSYTKAQGSSFSKEMIKEAAVAASGMTMMEVEAALCVAVVSSKGKKIDTDIIFHEKAQVVKKTGLLEFVPSEMDLDRDAGGLTVIKEWIRRVAKSFHNREAAAEYKLPLPKGVLVSGIPGTGKSLFAKCVANLFGVPLFRLDIGRLFAGVVGSTEKHTRDVLALAEAMAPCVVFIDEVERGLSGSGSSDRTDGGTASRLVGTLLSWMQDKTAPVYVVMTANEVTNLPAPLLRRGRLDEFWFVDLPSEDERAQIFAIHLTRKGRDMKNFPSAKIKQLAKTTEGFTGAEIEDAVNQAMFMAFSEDREFTVKDIETAASTITPIKDIKVDEIAELRKWAKETRARQANAPAQLKASITKKMKDKPAGPIMF